MKEKDIFMEEYHFKGKHAMMARQLTNIFDEETKAKVFETNIALFMHSAIIGVDLNLTSKPEKSTDVTKIMIEAMINNNKELVYTYRLVLLNAFKQDKSKAIQVAFKDYKNKEYFDLFESYMLGGLEYLHSLFFKKHKTKFQEYLIELKKIIIDYKDDDFEEDNVFLENIIPF